MTIEPEWVAALRKAVRSSFPDGIANSTTAIVSLASVRQDGSPKLQRLHALELLRSDPKVLVLAGATRNAELMAVLKGTRSHELLWTLASGETFTLTGRIHIVAAPSLSHRYGTPPKRTGIPDDAHIDADEFWEGERLRLWKTISPMLRATFSWPASGEQRTQSASSSWSAFGSQAVRKSQSSDAGFKYMRLDAIEEAAVNILDRKSISSPTQPQSILGALISNSVGRNASETNDKNSILSSSLTSLSGSSDELQCVHNAALDNFCLLVFKPNRVDHVAQSANAPPERVVYTLSKGGSWSRQELNP